MQDGKTIIYASDESGVNNLHTGNIETRQYHRFTDVLGGLFTPSVHEEKGRIAFSAFVKGGWDVYVSDDLNTMLQHNYPQPDKPVLAYEPPDNRLPSSEDSTASVPDSSLAQKHAPAGADTTAGAGIGDIDLDTYEPKTIPWATPRRWRKPDPARRLTVCIRPAERQRRASVVFRAPRCTDGSR
jgi:hypothetical protein